MRPRSAPSGPSRAFQGVLEGKVWRGGRARKGLRGQKTLLPGVFLPPVLKAASSSGPFPSSLRCPHS